MDDPNQFTGKRRNFPAWAAFRSRLLHWALAAVFLLGGMAPLGAAETKDYPPLEIGVGDLLTIMVVGYQHSTGRISAPSAFSNNDNNIDLPTDYLVDTNGEILFPFVGNVQVAGKTQISASKMLMTKLSKYLKFPQVTILIRQSNSYNVSVLGQVAHPGQYLIRGRPTLLSVLSEAGGPLENADLGGTILVRDGQKSGIDIGKFLLDKGLREKDPVVYPGDILMVPKSGWPSPGEWAIIASILASGVVIFDHLVK